MTAPSLVPLLLLTLVCDIAAAGGGARILGIFPHSGRSHFDVFEPILEQLAVRGHEVTVLSHFPRPRGRQPLDNYRDVTPKLHQVTAGTSRSHVDVEQVTITSAFHDAVHVATLGAATCQQWMNDASVANVLESNASFDAVVSEYFNTDCFDWVADRVGAARILITSSAMMPWGRHRSVAPDHPAYIPVVFHGSSPNMDFWSRLVNTLHYVIHPVIYRVYGDDRPLEAAPTHADVCILLVNTHFTITGPRPWPQNVLEVAGIHLGAVKELPQELRTFLETPDGVIVFSLGSLARGTSLSEARRRAFVEAFRGRRERVLWKWEGDNDGEVLACLQGGQLPPEECLQDDGEGFDRDQRTHKGKQECPTGPKDRKGKPYNLLKGGNDLPPNVRTSAWLPQFDVLHHPRVRLFITHAGLLSTIEAVHAGVPMLTIPLFGDQHMNAAAMVEAGVARRLRFQDITQEKLEEAIDSILKDPGYRGRARALSAAFRDRPVPPLEAAVHGIESCVRHHGTWPRYGGAWQDLNLLQYLLLDVAAAIVAGVALLLTTLAVALRWAVARLRDGSSGEKPTAKCQ